MRHDRVVLSLLLPLFVGCATIGDLTQKPGQATAETASAPAETVDEIQLQPYDGPRARVAVYRFTDRSAKGKLTPEIGDGMADMLSDALLQSSRFIIVDRQALADVLEEQDLGTGGRVNRATAAPVGQIEGADLLVKGSVTEFEPGSAGARAGVGGTPGRGVLGWGRALAGGVAGGLQQSHVAVIIQVVDVRTSRILFSTTVEGKANDFDIGGFLAGFSGGVAGSGELGVWQKTPVEKAIRIATVHAVQALTARTPRAYFRYREGTAGATGATTNTITPLAGTVRSSSPPSQSAPPRSGPPSASSSSVTSGTSKPSVTSPPAAPSIQASTKPDVAVRSLLPSVVFVSVGMANVRDTAGLEGKIVAVVREGTKLTVLGEHQGWYFIDTDDGPEGWISKSLTRP